MAFLQENNKQAEGERRDSAQGQALVFEDSDRRKG
jgi:hypothetical protein